MRRLTYAAALLPVLAVPAASQTGDGQLVLSGQAGQLSIAGYEIDVDQVRLPDAGGAVLSGATLTRPGRDGHVLIRQIEFPDTGLLSQILAPASECDPTEAASGTVLARDVRFRPDSDLGVTGGQEEIRIPLVTIETARISCSWRMTGLADGVVISGVDGSRIDIMTLETRVRMSGPELDARVDLFGLSLTGAEGPGGLRAEELGFSVTADLSEGALISLIGSGAQLPDIMAVATGSVTRGGVYLRGLELVPDLFLPERDLQRLGLEGVGAVAGDADLAVSVEMGDFRVRGSSDLSGLVRGSLDVSGALPEAGGISVPDAIAGSVPVPAELIGVSLERVSLRYEDLGAAGIVEHLTGRTVEDLAGEMIGARLDRVSSRLPGGLPATVGAGWGAIMDLLRYGGAAGLRPDQPFSLLELAVSGMMGPAMAAGRTGAWREN